MIPPHAITLWLTAETITIRYPDGQQIPIPAAEPGRIITILRSQENKARPVDKLLLYRREFQAAFKHEDVVKKGAEVRKKHEDALTRTALRKEKEKAQRMKRIEQMDKVKAAEELLALVGL